MTLEDFLKADDAPMTKTELASALNVSVITVNRWLNGTRFPEKEMVLRVEEVTNGGVQPADWYVAKKKPVTTEERAA
jgi:transcriptional regulator with XRE-family HTH domain